MNRSNALLQLLWKFSTFGTRVLRSLRASREKVRFSPSVSASIDLRLSQILHSVIRKRQERFIQIKLVLAHDKTRERISYLRDFRRTHEQLRVMTGTQGGLKGLGSENMLDVNMEDEVRAAYDGLRNVPVLDTSLGM